MLGFSGELRYSDHQNGIRLESTSITAFRIDGDGSHVSFRGTAKVNGKKGYTFVVDIVDGAEGPEEPLRSVPRRGVREDQELLREVHGPFGF